MQRCRLLWAPLEWLGVPLAVLRHTFSEATCQSLYGTSVVGVPPHSSLQGSSSPAGGQH